MRAVVVWVEAAAHCLDDITRFFKQITTFIKTSLMVTTTENYSISILDILNKFIPIKNETEIIETEKSCDVDGYVIMGKLNWTYSKLPKIFYQNITTIEAKKNDTNNTSQQNVLRLDIPIQEIGLIINHTIDELFNILLTANK